MEHINYAHKKQNLNIAISSMQSKRSYSQQNIIHTTVLCT